jgi:ferredoxin
LRAQLCWVWVWVWVYLTDSTGCGVCLSVCLAGPRCQIEPLVKRVEAAQRAALASEAARVVADRERVEAVQEMQEEMQHVARRCESAMALHRMAAQRAEDADGARASAEAQLARERGVAEVAEAERAAAAEALRERVVVRHTVAVMMMRCMC